MRASWALAVAVEVATFYMSFSYVVIQSPWAFWGSLIGAFVVFWGNLSSMYEARMERLRAVNAPSANEDSPAKEKPGVRVQAEPIQTGPMKERSQYVFKTLLAAEEVETKISQVRQSVRAVAAKVPPRSEPLPEASQLAEDEAGQESTLLLAESDKEVLRLATLGPVGPSGISRALGIAKSSAGDRLKKLERMGLLVKDSSGYVLTGQAQSLQKG